MNPLEQQVLDAVSKVETLRDKVIAHRHYEIDTITRCDDWFTDADPDDPSGMRGAFLAVKTHAEHSRDRLTAMLEES